MMKNTYVSRLFSGIILAALLGAVSFVHAAGITADVNNDMGEVNYGVLGNVIRSEHTSGSWSLPYFINGGGVWDVNGYRSEPEMLSFAQDIGIRYSRFTGLNDWINRIGPMNLRPDIMDYDEDGILEKVTFGIPEFLQNQENIGSVPVFLVSDTTGTADDAAGLVRYLNAPCSAPYCTTVMDQAICADAYDEAVNNGNSNYLPQLRVCDKAALGREDLDETWNAIWFEYGNESFSDHTADEYIAEYIDYRDSMRAIDANIKLGAVLGNIIYPSHVEWNYRVIQGTGDYADFYIIHKYLPWDNTYEGSDAEEIFRIGLAGTNEQLRDHFRENNFMICELSGRCDVPIAVTEYNGGFMGSATQTYGYVMGNALIIADYIRQLMHAENIFLATYFHLNHMIKASGNVYTRRPTYYALQFYNNYFGDVLVDSSVVIDDMNNDTYTVDEYKYKVEPAYGVQKTEEVFDDVLQTEAWNIQDPQPAGVSSAYVDQEGALTIDFNGSADVDYSHSHKNAAIESSALYRLSGFVKTENITTDEGIFLGVKSGTNNLLNGGFEDGLTGWSENGIAGNAYLEEESGHVLDGSRSMRIEFNGGTTGYSVCKDLDLEPETTYVLEGYILSENLLTPESIGVHLQLRDVRGATYGFWKTSNMHTDKNWGHLSIDIKTHADTGPVRACLARYGGEPISGTVWVDGISVTNMSRSSKITGTEGNNYYWKYFTVDYISRSGVNNAAVFAGRNMNGDAGGPYINGRVKFKNVKLRKIITGNFGAVPYLSVNASRSADESRIFLMVMNRNMTDDVTAPVNLAGFDPVLAQSWTLNAAAVDSINDAGVVYNSGFEDIIDSNSWIFNSSENLSIDIDRTVSHNGSSSARFVYTTDTGYGNQYQDVYVNPDTTYRVEGYIKAALGSSTNGVRIHVGDYRQGHDYGSTPEVHGTSDWTRVEHEFTTASDTTKVQVYASRISGNGSAGDTAWFDDIKLTRISGVSESGTDITYNNIGPVTNGFEFTFPAHSLTSLVIDTDNDNDGLTDNDEIHIYGTDPLNPDTDHDTILDGTEVSQGSDPLGIFSPNNEGWKISKNSDFSTSDTGFSTTDTFHIIVWSNVANAQPMKKAEYKIKNTSGDVHKEDVVETGPSVYTENVSLSGFGTGPYTVEIWLRDNNNVEYEVRDIYIEVQ